jgi:NCS1 family nucleobase:cation symporter-1
VGLIIANATNTYGGGITGISMLDNVRPTKSTVPLRIVATTVVSILAVLLAVVGSSDLGTFITNFFFFLLYGLIPWSMINLVDFFLIRRGQYKTDDFFDPKGSFGAFGWPALIVYAIAILAELPFVNTALFVGPAVEWLGGADVAWIVGAIVSGVLYYFVARYLRIGVRG